MTRDALDPGDDYSYPFLPRDADGYLNTDLVPIGKRWQKGVLVDVEPSVRLADGTLVKVSAICPVRPEDAP